MINLETGTNSVWLSLRESLPSGSTNSTNFQFVFKQDITGMTWTFNPTDLTPTAKWSSFNIAIGTPQSLTQSRLNMKTGQYTYNVYDNHSGTLLETGKVNVGIQNEITAVTSPAKNTTAVRR